MKKLLKLFACLLVASLALVGLVACGNTDTLIVYTESGFAPFEYVKDGAIVGVDVDIMELVGKKLNKKIVFESVSFDSIIDAVSAGTLTNVGAAGLSVTPAREEKVDFSKQYYTAKLYVVYKTADAAQYEVKTNGNARVYWSKFIGKKIGCQTGTTADLFIGDELDIHYEDDEETIVDWVGALYDEVEGEALASKTGYATYDTALADIGLNIDVLVMDELPAQQLIAGKSSYKCAPLYYEDEVEGDFAAEDVYAIAVTKGQTELLNAINEVLDELGEDGIQELVMKHLGLDD